jgi:hypothetical protein
LFKAYPAKHPGRQPVHRPAWQRSGRNAERRQYFEGCVRRGVAASDRNRARLRLCGLEQSGAQIMPVCRYDFRDIARASPTHHQAQRTRPNASHAAGVTVQDNNDPLAARLGPVSRPAQVRIAGFQSQHHSRLLPRPRGEIGGVGWLHERGDDAKLE